MHSIIITLFITLRSTEGSWWQQYEGPGYHQASEYVQAETALVSGLLTLDMV